MSSSPNSLSSFDALPPAEGLSWVMDVPCPIDFVLGTATVKVRDCMAFGPESVVRLKEPAGADIEVRVGGVAMASGEVVIVEESVGLRLNRILPPAGQEML